MSYRGLPSGTLTFLFTDIEGSTKLLNALGTDRYHEVLAAHTKTLRAACFCRARVMSAMEAWPMRPPKGRGSDSSPA